MISTAQMHFDKKTATFTAEMSDFGPAFKWIRVWPDSCDAGVDILSHKTGKTMRFVCVQVDQHEGDICAWHFVPAERNYRDLCQVTLFND